MNFKFKNMKKRITLQIAFCAFLLVFVSCDKKKTENEQKPQPTPTVVDSYDFDKVIVADCQKIKDMYGDDYMFFEAKVLFADSVHKLTKPTIISMETVFQVEDTVVLIDHNANEFEAEPEITAFIDHVIGDMVIDINDIPVSFSQAWVLLHESELPLPTGMTMTMRTALAPPFDEYPSYIFSTSDGKYIRVYSGDGRVEEFE